MVVEISQCAEILDLGAPSRDEVMTREVTHCLSSDPLADVWKTMKARDIQSIPVLAENRVPVGIVYARDALQCLLQEVETDDELLRDFISGVAYR